MPLGFSMGLHIVMRMLSVLISSVLLAGCLPESVGNGSEFYINARIVASGPESDVEGFRNSTMAAGEEVELSVASFKLSLGSKTWFYDFSWSSSDDGVVRVGSALAPTTTATVLADGIATISANYCTTDADEIEVLNTSKLNAAEYTDTSVSPSETGYCYSLQQTVNVSDNSVNLSEAKDVVASYTVNGISVYENGSILPSLYNGELNRYEVTVPRTLFNRLYFEVKMVIPDELEHARLNLDYEVWGEGHLYYDSSSVIRTAEGDYTVIKGAAEMASAVYPDGSIADDYIRIAPEVNLGDSSDWQDVRLSDWLYILFEDVVPTNEFILNFDTDVVNNDAGEIARIALIDYDVLLHSNENWHHTDNNWSQVWDGVGQTPNSFEFYDDKWAHEGNNIRLEIDWQATTHNCYFVPTTGSSNTSAISSDGQTLDTTVVAGTNETTVRCEAR
jgi:hypothetical protein